MPNSTFVGRDEELKRLHEAFSQNPSQDQSVICFLKGGGGIGKTQIALQYESLHEADYDRTIFVDCESIETFKDSLKAIAKDLTGKTQENLENNRSLLKDHFLKEKCLLIIDNVDTPKIAKEVELLLPAQGHVIITGRYDINKRTIPVGALSFERGVELFKEVLNKDCRESFEQQNYSKEDLKRFISDDLGGIPLAIRVAAMYFNTHNLGRRNLTIGDYSQGLKKLDLDSLKDRLNYISDIVELGYTKTIAETYRQSIKSIESDFEDWPLAKVMVRDVLHFFAFFGTHQDIALPDPNSMEALLKSFANSSKNKVYQVSKEQFESDFNKLFEKLVKYSLIFKTKQPLNGKEIITVTMPQTVKWAMQYDFLSSPEVQAVEVPNKKRIEGAQKEYDEKYRLIRFLFYITPDEFRANRQYEIDIKKYAWFFGACQYFNALAKPDHIDKDYLIDLLSFMNFINDYQLSKRLKAQFINEMKILSNFRRAFVEGKPDLLEEVKKLPADDLYKLLQDPVNESKLSDDVAKAVIKLGRLFIEIDFGRAKTLFDRVLEEGHTDVHFDLGMLYWTSAFKEKATQNPSHESIKALIKKAIDHYSVLIKLKTTNTAPAYNNRGLCYEELGEYENAASDYSQAKNKDPDEPIYYRKLSNVRLKAGQKLEHEKYKNIADNLEFLKQQQEYQKISSYYKATLRNFFNADKIFIHKENWLTHSMDVDKGVLFGKMLNRNSSVTTVHLYGCDLNDDGLRSIANSLESNDNIEVLKLEWNSPVTDKGVQCLADALKQNKKIKEISLSKCKNITVASIEYLINSGSENLKIRLYDCPNLKKFEQKLTDLAQRKKIIVTFMESE